VSGLWGAELRYGSVLPALRLAVGQGRPCSRGAQGRPILFVDLVEFTSRSDQADPEDVRAMLVPYHARVESEIESFGRIVEKFIGDAVMALFGRRPPMATMPSERFARDCESSRPSRS
jgi:class 3 adenylate cyclase